METLFLILSYAFVFALGGFTSTVLWVRYLQQYMTTEEIKYYFVTKRGTKA